MAIYGHALAQAPAAPRPSSSSRCGASRSAGASRRSAPQRCMFESNFPVDKVSCTYADLWQAFELIAADASPVRARRPLRRHRVARLPPLRPARPSVSPHASDGGDASRLRRWADAAAASTRRLRARGLGDVARFVAHVRADLPRRGPRRDAGGPGGRHRRCSTTPATTTRPGTAPIPTGWSEVVFGELFRGAGWDRDAVTVCNKLWWEHWPDEDAATELDGSLERMGLDHVDVIYAIAAPTAPPVEVVVEQVAGLIASGRARAWGTGMWSGRRLAAALDVCDATGAPYPVAAQMACSLADHRQSGDPDGQRRARSRRDRARRRLRPRRRHADRQVRIGRPRPVGRRHLAGRGARQGDRRPARRAGRRLGRPDGPPGLRLRPRPPAPGDRAVRGDVGRPGPRQRRPPSPPSSRSTTRSAPPSPRSPDGGPRRDITVAVPSARRALARCLTPIGAPRCCRGRRTVRRGPIPGAPSAVRWARTSTRASDPTSRACAPSPSSPSSSSTPACSGSTAGSSASTCSSCCRATSSPG